MAHLDVEPKKGNSYLTTILIAFGLLVLLYFLAKGCTNHEVGTPPKHTSTTIESNLTPRS